MSKLDYRFWIWPKYRLEYKGRQVEFPDSEGELLMILLANPGRRLTRTELVNARYGHREDGGPMTAANLQRTYVSYLRRRLRKHAINVHIDGFVGLGGFAFRGFSLCKPDKQAAVPVIELMEAA